MSPPSTAGLLAILLGAGLIGNTVVGGLPDKLITAGGGTPLTGAGSASGAGSAADALSGVAAAADSAVAGSTEGSPVQGIGNPIPSPAPVFTTPVPGTTQSLGNPVVSLDGSK